MEQLLHTMVILSPVGLAIIACVAFGLALSAREALGTERGLRTAAEQSRAAAVRALTSNKDWELEEVGRFRRLLECHAETIIAEASDFRERSVPSPASILEGLCSWNQDWKRQLAAYAGLGSDDVDRLLKNDLPITPSLARSLEIFTGAPARFWERLSRLHDEYRTETDKTVTLLIDSATRAEALSKRPVLELVDDSRPAAGSTAAKPPVELQAPPQALRAERAEPAAGPPTRRPAVEVHPPVVANPELAHRGQRGKLPPPPQPRHRSPIASPDGRTAQRRAETLTDFPIQRAPSHGATGDDWPEAERSPLNATLRGVGGKPSQ